MNILINLSPERRAQLLTDSDHAALSALGAVTFFDPQGDADFAAEVSAADAILTGWGSRPLDTTVLGARERPLLMAHAAGSIRHLVPKDLLGRGVRVTQGAAAIAAAVAPYTVGLIVLGLRQAFARSEAYRAGRAAALSGPGLGPEGLTIGLVALSQVGRRVPPLLHPFGCRIVAYDPYAPEEMFAALGIERAATLDEMVASCDVVSLHAPVTDETRNLLDARRIALLQPGALLVNTARGALLDHDALFARCLAGEITACLDVTEPEPLPADHPARNCPHVFLTPHIAGLTVQSLRRIVDNAVAEIGRFSRGEPLVSEVTLERYDLLA